MDLEKRNDAPRVNGFTVNGQSVDIHQTVRGSDFYWAWTAVMFFATICFILLAARKPRQHRIFHYITAAVTFTAGVAYFSMASNLGWTPIVVEWFRSDPQVRGRNRQIFYVRYIDWFITTPLLLLDLLLTAGMPWPTILWIIFVDLVMIVCGLVGALVRSSYKWGYYTIGDVCLLYIVYHLVWESRKHAAAIGPDIHRAFLMCGTLTAIVWICYPIAWGVCEGGNVIAPDSEAVFYGVLDFFAKVVFGALLIWNHRNIDPGRLGLRIRDYDEDPAIHGGPDGARAEKLNHPHPQGTNGVHDTTTGAAGV